MRSLAQSAKRQDLAGNASKNSLFSRRDAVAGLRHLKIALPTIYGHQIGHQLSCHCERRAIGIAFLLFAVVEQGQHRAVARRHLGRLDQRRLQMLVALFGQRRPLRRVALNLFCTGSLSTRSS